MAPISLKEQSLNMRCNTLPWRRWQRERLEDMTPAVSHCLKKLRRLKSCCKVYERGFEEEEKRKKAGKSKETVDKSWERALYSLTKQAYNSSSGLPLWTHRHRRARAHTRTHTQYISPGHTAPLLVWGALDLPLRAIHAAGQTLSGN